MEEKLSEVLDNLLGMLLLEGSYEIEEEEEGFMVAIKTSDAGRLIGVRGESLKNPRTFFTASLKKKDPPRSPAISS